MTDVEICVRQSILALRDGSVQSPLQLDLDLRLFEDYGLSSLQIISLLASVCDQCGIDLMSMADRDRATLKTPRDVIGALKKLREDQRPGWARGRHTTLENDIILLRPMAAADREQLRAIAVDEDIWRYFVLQLRNDADLEKFIADAVRDTEVGTRIVFSIVVKREGSIAGSTAFLNMAEAERRLEIGASWLGREFRCAGINHWAKYLMLEYAFETLGCERVEFKTDVLNQRARKALLKIGAKEEGVLRSFNFMPGNRRRDAVFYSILKHEWPSVKAMLSAGASKFRTGPSELTSLQI
jgi:RimJ/RimL family protein N-acetyltransferase